MVQAGKLDGDWMEALLSSEAALSPIITAQPGS